MRRRVRCLKGVSGVSKVWDVLGSYGRLGDGGASIVPFCPWCRFARSNFPIPDSSPLLNEHKITMRHGWSQDRRKWPTSNRPLVSVGELVFLDSAAQCLISPCRGPPRPFSDSIGDYRGRRGSLRRRARGRRLREFRPQWSLKRMERQRGGRDVLGGPGGEFGGIWFVWGNAAGRGEKRQGCPECCVFRGRSNA